MMVTTARKQFDTIEKESLEAHVEMCAHRHATLEKQIANIERIVKDFDVRARESRVIVIKSIGIAIAVMTSIVSGVVFLIERLG